MHTACIDVAVSETELSGQRRLEQPIMNPTRLDPKTAVRSTGEVGEWTGLITATFFRSGSKI
jgi:hypothetical protein